MSYSEDGRYVEARCVTEDTYFERGSLYPGYPCIMDLECASKQCSYGFC